MGMGDEKKRYSPTYGKKLDVVLNRYFADCSVRECHHPNVIKRFGTGGVATVSLYTCKKCRHGKKEKLYGGWYCGYNAVEQGVQASTEG